MSRVTAFHSRHVVGQPGVHAGQLKHAAPAIHVRPQPNKEHAVYRIIITPRPVFESPAPSAARPLSARKLADAELQFEGPLTGLALVGFAVWDHGEQGYRVSFPSRRYVSANGRRRSFLLLRSIDPEDRTSCEVLHRDIVAAYEAVQQARTASAQVAAS
jgi:hypothetical protein